MPTPGTRAWSKGFDKLSPNGVCVARTGCLLGPDRVFARPVRVVTQPSRAASAVMPIQSHAQCADGVVRIRVGDQPACLSCVLALRLIAQQQPIDSSRGPPTKSQPSASVNRSNPSPSRRRATRLKKRDVPGGSAGGPICHGCLRWHGAGQRRGGAGQSVAQRQLVEQEAVHWRVVRQQQVNHAVRVIGANILLLRFGRWQRGGIARMGSP